MFVWCFNCILQSVRCSTYAYMFICFMAQICGLVSLPSASIVLWWEQRLCSIAPSASSVSLVATTFVQHCAKKECGKSSTTPTVAIGRGKSSTTPVLFVCSALCHCWTTGYLLVVDLCHRWRCSKDSMHLVAIAQFTLLHKWKKACLTLIVHNTCL